MHELTGNLQPWLRRRAEKIRATPLISPPMLSSMVTLSSLLFHNWAPLRIFSKAPERYDIHYWSFNTKVQIRLYFIRGTAPDLYLAELFKSGDGDWAKGSLTDNRIRITGDSLIFANVEDGSGDLKVFFNTKDDDGVAVPAVAWVVLGQETWSSRVIGQWK